MEFTLTGNKLIINNKNHHFQLDWIGLWTCFCSALLSLPWSHWSSLSYTFIIIGCYLWKYIVAPSLHILLPKNSVLFNTIIYIPHFWLFFLSFRMWLSLMHVLIDRQNLISADLILMMSIFVSTNCHIVTTYI